MQKYRIEYQFATIIVMLCSFISGCNSTKIKPDAYKDMDAAQIYSKGKAAALEKKYTIAIKDFEELESRFPYGQYTDKAQLALVHAYFKQGNSASSLAIADRFIRIHPRHVNVDYAYYMKGFVNYQENFSPVYQYFPIDRCLRDPTLAQQAFDDFKALVQRFPNSKYAQDARQRMVHLRNQLAKYELSVADYYMTQKAYLAAANRAGYIVNYFTQTDVVPEALLIMIKAYEKMNMPELVATTTEVLRNNFPEIVIEKINKK